MFILLYISFDYLGRILVQFLSRVLKLKPWLLILIKLIRETRVVKTYVVLLNHPVVNIGVLE